MRGSVRGAGGNARPYRNSETAQGTPQGASVSTLLSNVYLHYVFDLWVRQWRQQHARGDMLVVRFADL
jgi:RNA-directed DNA polymerase